MAYELAPPKPLDLSGSDPLTDVLSKAKVRMLFNQPFWGQVISRMELVEVTWCQTAATDGARIYFNRQFVLNLPPDGLVFLLGHEVLHAVLDHLTRRNDRDPKVWNMANDYLINYMLVKNGFEDMPKGGLLKINQYTDEWTSEEIYDDLIENSVEVEANFDEHFDFSGGDEIEDDSDGGEGQGNESGGSKTVKVRVFGEDGPPKLTEKDMRKIRNDLKHIVIQAAQTVDSSDVPLGIRRIIDSLLAPKLDWRSLLEVTIRSCQKDDYTFMKPSRKSHGIAALTGQGVILPGQNTPDTIDIWAVIDASGSLTEEMLRDFTSEVKGIMECFPDFRLRLFSFDTMVYKVWEFTPQNIHEIHEFDPEGKGATHFECVFDFLKDIGEVPERLVFFTDGLPNRTWGDPKFCDTLFIIYGDRTIKAPFGITVPYEPKAVNSNFVAPPMATAIPSMVA